MGGFLSGLLGIGGALIFMPILNYLVKSAAIGNESVPYLLANSFVLVFIASVSASYKQYKVKNFYPKKGLGIALPATIVSLIVTSGIQYVLTQTDLNLKLYFKVIFLILLVLIAVYSFLAKASNHYTKKPDDLTPIQTKLAGITVGFFSAITGLGGGVVMIPLFHNIYKVKYSNTIALSSLVIGIFTLPNLFYYAFLNPVKGIAHTLQTGYICWSWVLPMLPFIVIFSNIGVRMNQVFPVWVSKFIFAAIIIINIFKTITL